MPCVGAFAALLFKTINAALTPRRSVKVCHVNVRSVASKARLLDLELLCVNHNLDILCLSETWLSQSHPSATLSIHGFQLPFRRDSPDDPHGGVAVYVRNSLSSTLLPLPHTITIECLCIQILITSSTKLNILTCVTSSILSN